MVSDLKESASSAPIDQPFIGQRIKQARLSSGLTQVQLAERLDVGQALVAKWENSQRSISIKYLAQVAKACGTNLDFFLELNKHIYDGEPVAENQINYVINNSNSLPIGLVKLARDLRSDNYINISDDEWCALLGLAKSWSLASTASKSDWLGLLFHLRSISYLHDPPHAA